MKMNLKLKGGEDVDRIHLAHDMLQGANLSSFDIGF